MLGGYFFNAISSTVVSSLRNTNDVGGGSVAANNTWLGITPGTGQTITNTAVSRPLTTVATPDLTGPTDPIKISMVTPLFKMLSSYEEALNDLEDVDTDYQTQAEQIWTLYQNRTYGQVLASVQACYDQLMSIDPNLSNLSPAQTAQAQADMDLLKARATTFAAGNDLLNSDGTKIDAARKLVADTRTRINRSNSSAEINSIFSTFQNALDVDSLPSITEAAARTSQFEKIKRVLGGDLRLPGNNTPAILENISNRCSNEYLPQAQGIQPPTQTDSVSGA